MTIKSFTAGANFTDKLGYAVMTSGTSGTVSLATANADCMGILANDAESGYQVPVALCGEVTKAKLGGSVSQGDPLKATTGGSLIEAGGTSDDNVIAVALEDGSSGDLIDVNVVKFIK